MNRKTTGDTFLMKKINKYIVLQTIMAHNPISRADISGKTGLNKATVSSLVNELMSAQLVYETGLGASSGGRKPVMLMFRQTAGFAIGIDLGVNYVLALLTDLNGNVIKETRKELSDHSVEQAANLLTDTIRELAEIAPESPYGIVGIGVGVPGVVDVEGTILSAPNLGWKNVPLRKMLAERFLFPVIIDNEANAGAWGEKQFGAGKNSANMLYVSVGIGIGVGVVIQHELYRGAGGFAGEAGHMAIIADGEQCSCGSRGCWELYASENTILRMAEKKGVSGNLHHLIERAAMHDQEIIAAIAYAGRNLGIGLANLANAFNPEKIIVGNRITLAREWIEEPMAAAFSERCLPFHKNATEILFSGLAMRSTALGGAHFAIAHFFAEMKAKLD
ncbi:MAG TPA: ROK family transcriptional regulator [Bacilli bacterium]